MEETSKIKIFYDDECTLCSRFKFALEKIDLENKIEFYSIRDTETFKKFPQLDPVECHDTIHAIDTQGKIHHSANVIPVIAEQLPGVSKFAWLLENEASKKALDMFYSAVNNVRKSKVNPCRNCRES